MTKDLKNEQMPQPAAKATPQSADLAKTDAENTAINTTTPEEIGGREGPEPTRYGDWEAKGICSDF